MAGSTDAGGRGSGSGSGSGSDSDNAGPTPVLARCSAWSPTARCPLRCPARAGAHLLGGGGAAHDSQPGLAVAHAGAVLLIPRPAQHPPQLPLDAHQRRGQVAQPARRGGGGGGGHSNRLRAWARPQQGWRHSGPRAGHVGIGRRAPQGPPASQPDGRRWAPMGMLSLVGGVRRLLVLLSGGDHGRRQAALAQRGPHARVALAAPQRRAPDRPALRHGRA